MDELRKCVEAGDAEHQLIIRAYAQHDVSPAGAGAFAGFCILLLGSSAALYFLVEKPMRKIIRGAFESRHEYKVAV
jgi:peptidoglycan/LPS O-acetylase OafA/YrhL